MGTPLTSPSETTSPVATDIPPKNAPHHMLIYQSDPSLPALLSGASSISADIEGELLCKPGVVNSRSPRLDSSDQTPPALAKDALAMDQDRVFENDTAMESGPLHIPAAEPKSPSTIAADSHPDDADEDGSDDDILVMAKSRKRTSLLPRAPTSRPFEAKRRDTGASTASNETAKKVPVHDDSSFQPEP